FRLIEGALNGQGAQAVRMLAGLRAEGEAVPALMGMVVMELQRMAVLARVKAHGGNLGAEFKAQRIWDAREAAYRRALERHPPGRWERFVAAAGEVDRVAKGRGDGDAWRLLERLLLAVADARAVPLLAACACWPATAAASTRSTWATSRWRARSATRSGPRWCWCPRPIRRTRPRPTPAPPSVRTCSTWRWPGRRAWPWTGSSWGAAVPPTPSTPCACSGPARARTGRWRGWWGPTRCSGSTAGTAGASCSPTPTCWRWNAPAPRWRTPCSATSRPRWPRNWPPAAVRRRRSPRPPRA